MDGRIGSVSLPSNTTQHYHTHNNVLLANQPYHPPHKTNAATAPITGRAAPIATLFAAPENCAVPADVVPLARADDEAAAAADEAVPAAADAVPTEPAGNEPTAEVVP